MFIVHRSRPVENIVHVLDKRAVNLHTVPIAKENGGKHINLCEKERKKEISPYSNFVTEL